MFQLLCSWARTFGTQGKVLHSSYWPNLFAPQPKKLDEHIDTVTHRLEFEYEISSIVCQFSKVSSKSSATSWLARTKVRCLQVPVEAVGA